MGTIRVMAQSLATLSVLLLSGCHCAAGQNGPEVRDDTWANVDCVIQTRKLTKNSVVQTLGNVVDGNVTISATGEGKDTFSPILYSNPRFDLPLASKLSSQMVRYFADEGLTKKSNGRPRVSPVTMLAYASIQPGICLSLGRDCERRSEARSGKFLTYATSHRFWPKAHGVLSVERGSSVGIGTTAIIDNEGALRAAESGDDPKGADFTVFVLKSDPDIERHIDEISAVLALAFGDSTKQYFTSHWDGKETIYDRLNPDALPQVLSAKVRICRLP